LISRTETFRRVNISMHVAHHALFLAPVASSLHAHHDTCTHSRRPTSKMLYWYTLNWFATRLFPLELLRHSLHGLNVSLELSCHGVLHRRYDRIGGIWREHSAVQKVCRVSFDPDTRLTGQMSEECQKAGVPLDQEVSVRAIYHQSDRTRTTLYTPSARLLEPHCPCPASSSALARSCPRSCQYLEDWSDVGRVPKGRCTPRPRGECSRHIPPIRSYRLCLHGCSNLTVHAQLHHLHWRDPAPARVNTLRSASSRLSRRSSKQAQML
jgi:hypothetical protein